MRNIRYIPFLYTNLQLRAEILKTFETFYDSNNYILGDQLKKFEAAWAEYSGTRYAVGTGNGHDALLIALKSLGIGPGDEVILPANTFVATALAVHHTGANPVLADPEPDEFNLTAISFEKHITTKTKAIIPVHLYGIPCDLDDILTLSGQNHLLVVEDNAQAQGALYHGKKTGSFGQISTTSFYPAKNLGAFGDGGMITTNSTDMARLAKKLRNYGSGERGTHDVIGYNSRLDELQAALLSVKLKYLDKQNQERQIIAHSYIKHLEKCKHIQFSKIPPETVPVYHVFPIFTQHRDALKDWLEEKGIDTLIHYPIPIHLQGAFKYLDHTEGDFPRAEQLSGTTLSLPIYPGLTEDDITYICQSILDFFNEKPQDVKE